jgi:uncharacterized membrane protein YphA (DoxX/SURF4 family)
MSFGSYAGTAIVPTLSRIVLGVAFLTAGYGKVFQTVEFVGDDAARLMKLNVLEGPSVSAGHRELVVQPASLVQDGGDKGETTKESGQAAPDDKAAAADSTTPADAGTDHADETGDKAMAPASDARGQALAMHRVTLRIDRAGWPYPVWLARLVAFTELIGGALLLLGLFGRLWGLAFAIEMAGAFYLTSMDSYFSTGVFTTARGADGFALFNQVFAQAGLFVLAFGILLTGPGPLSLDRLFFGRRRTPTEVPSEPSFE